MKRVSVILIFCFFFLTTLLANINPDEMREINQKLNNILQVSQSLPQQKKDRIISEVKSIRQILEKENTKEVDENSQSTENRIEILDKLLMKNPYLTDVKHFDIQSMNNLKARIKAAKSYRAQLELIKRTNLGSTFTIEQILELTKLFPDLIEQKEVVLVLLPNAVDLENIDQLYNLFSSDSDKKVINKIADDNLH